MNKLDRAIELTEKKVRLLKELKVAQEREKCTYFLDRQHSHGSTYNYILVDQAKKEVVFCGTKAICIAYINKPWKVAKGPEDVYNYKLLK